MPQMSPMNWVNLFISFSLIYLLLNMNNYFFIKYQSMTTSKSFSSKYNWKW